MIHHADAALEAWFDELRPKVSVSFDAPTDEQRATAPRVHLELLGVREQTAKRNTEESDIRSDDGRVVARRRATRYFELDYRCSVSGQHPVAHEVLGAVLQLLVDHDVVPAEHVPDALSDIGEPIEVALAAPSTPTASITLRVVVPVQPTADDDVAPPAVELHLEMLPAPGRSAPTGRDRSHEADDVLRDRRWTTVRRRERIAPGEVDAS